LAKGGRQEALGHHGIEGRHQRRANFLKCSSVEFIGEAIQARRLVRGCTVHSGLQVLHGEWLL
jgi:hypothetical protein